MDMSGSASGSAFSGQDVVWTSTIDKRLPLKISNQGAGSKKPITVSAQLYHTVNRFGRRPAMKVQRNGQWQAWTWTEYFRDIQAFAKSLLKLGLQRFQCVNIIGFNAPEWSIANIGTIVAGGVAAGVYSTNTAAACQHIAAHSGAVVVVCEDNDQLAKYLSIRDQLPNVRMFVLYGCVPNVHGADIVTWEEFLRIGSDVPDAAILQCVQQQSPEDCCALIYTSGTTGPPKGVMISHDNVTWTANAVLDLFDADENERLVSYLPLSHVAAAMIDVYGPVMVGCSVTFAKPDALKGTLVDTLKQAKPTVLFGVPRVYEKIQEKLVQFGSRRSWVLRQMATWAKSLGYAASVAVETGGELPCGFWLANTLVLKQIKRALGLDCCRSLFAGAAPVAPETLRYFQSLFMPIHELYGMSECTGPETVNIPGALCTGTAGRAMGGTELMIDHPDTSGEGEICFRGRNVCMGYLHDPQKTMESISPDGFLHSGDLGFVDADGFLHITGRKKDLIITAGGENVPPTIIENVIKEEIACVSQAVVIGEARKYLAVLLSIKCIIDDHTGQPTNLLTEPCIQWARRFGSRATTVEAAMRCPQFMQGIEVCMDSVNRRSTSRAQLIRRWEILPTDLSVPGGELTPTLKVKRKFVEEKYAGLVAQMYTDKD